MFQIVTRVLDVLMVVLLCCAAVYWVCELAGIPLPSLLHLHKPAVVAATAMPFGYLLARLFTPIMVVHEHSMIIMERRPIPPDDASTHQSDGGTPPPEAPASQDADGDRS